MTTEQVPHPEQPNTGPTEVLPTVEVIPKKIPSWRRVGCIWFSSIAVGALSARYGIPIVDSVIHNFSDTQPSATALPFPHETPTNPGTPADTNDDETKDTDKNTGVSKSVKITFYGSYDNDPKGSLAISDPVIHQQAGGVGTYEDPLTFASPEGSGAYEVGTKIYVEMVRKYFIKEDTCAKSWTAPNGCGPVKMVDLYVGNPSSDEAVVKCEDYITPSGGGKIIINPPPGLPYDETPIWDQNTKTCMTPHQ